MLYSFSFHPCLLAICSIVTAQLDQGNIFQAPARGAKFDPRPAISEANDVQSTTAGFITYERDAVISLFPSSKPTHKSYRIGCPGPSVNAITLPTDVCLSSDDDVRYNMVVSETPVCHDGSKPRIRYYTARECAGKAKSEVLSTMIQDLCFWDQSNPQWSIIFRCGYEGSLAVVQNPQDIVPPPIGYETPNSLRRRPDLPYEHSLPSINVIPHSGFSSHPEPKPFQPPPFYGFYNVNDCRGNESVLCTPFKIPSILHACNQLQSSQKLNILQPVNCPDGYESALALFEGSSCNTPPLFQPLDAVELNQCVEYQDRGSWAFWCLRGSGRAATTSPHKTDSLDETPQERPLSETLWAGLKGALVPEWHNLPIKPGHVYSINVGDAISIEIPHELCIVAMLLLGALALWTLIFYIGVWLADLSVRIFAGPEERKLPVWVEKEWKSLDVKA